MHTGWTGLGRMAPRWATYFSGPQARRLSLGCLALSTLLFALAAAQLGDGWLWLFGTAGRAPA
jgi:hypothetical protein